MTLYLVNPGKRARGKGGRFVKAKPSRSRRKVTKAVGVTRRKRRTKRRRSTRIGGSVMARKRAANGRFLKSGARRRRSKRRASSAPRRRRRSTSAAAPRRRRRSYRRNPPVSGMIRTLTEGAQGAVAAIVGKAASRAIPQQVGLPTTGAMGIATQAGVALVLGMVASKVGGAARKHASFVVAGALMGPIEQVIRDLNIPVLSPALSAYPGYPMLPSGGPALALPGGSGLASYPGGMETY